jgi:hypothetical protein
MKKLAVMIVMTFVCASVFAETGARSRAVSPLAVNAAKSALLAKYSQADLEKGVYVGSNFCLACHTSKASYKDTNHASFIRRPVESLSLMPGKGVIADYDGNKVDDFRQGLDFNTISSPFDKYKPNAPKLSVENGTYYVTIATLKMPVAFTLAGQRNGSAQRFTVKVPVTDTASRLTVDNYFAPIQYTPGTGWAAYNPDRWYDSSNAPKFAAGIGSASLVGGSGFPSSHGGGCVGCHTPALQSMGKTAAGEWAPKIAPALLYTANDPTVVDYEADGEMEQMNIGCENCHGPGSLHILAGGDGSKIINPLTLTAQQKIEVCAQCHVTSTSVPNGTYSWPYNDASNTRWVPGTTEALSSYYRMGGAMFPDGKHYNGGRPYNAFSTSAHANFAAHTVGCPDCHDPHVEGEGMLIRDTMVEDNYKIKTSAEDNTLCLACHAKYGPFADFTRGDVFDMTQGSLVAKDKIAKTVENHTHHPYAPDRIMGLSRCTGCHMTAGGHSFDVLNPEDTLKYSDKSTGMANSCASGCHNTQVNIFNLGIKGAASGYNSPFDLALAKALKPYFGEGGTWWNTKP